MLTNFFLFFTVQSFFDCLFMDPWLDLTTQIKIFKLLMFKVFGNDMGEIFSFRARLLKLVWYSLAVILSINMFG